MKYKRNIYLLYAISLLQGMVFYGPIATLYRQAAGVTVFQITIIESVSIALCIILELPWGVIADRVGYKATMIVCCLLYFVSKIVFWKASDFDTFLLERIILSVVVAGMSGCDVTILYLSCNQSESQKVFSIYNNLSAMGLLFASFVYSVVIKDNYRLAGLYTVISYGVAALLTFGLQEVYSSFDKYPKRNIQTVTLLKQLFKNKQFIFFLIGIALLNETHQTITTFLNQLQYTKSGILPDAMGYIYILVTLVGLVGMASAWLTNKMGVKFLVSILYGSSICACIVMALTSNAILSVLGIVVLRLAFSLFQPLQTELQNKQIITENRATVLSINAMLIDGVGVATNIVFGKVAEVSLSGAMLCGAWLCAVGYILFFLWYTACNQHQK